MILVVGDIHGKFRYLNDLINRKNPSMILQVGDFGYWPKFKNNKEIKNKNTTIYFCDGNHEDHDSLKSLKDNEIQKNVFYMKRGSTLKLPDGRTVLFIGGAFSHDWEWREPGVSWFPFDEIVSEDDVNNTPDVDIDIIISHTAPKEFYLPIYSVHIEDPSREALSVLLKKYQPKWWYFGHFHEYLNGFDCGCRWTGLSYPESGFRWWVGLDLYRIE